MIEYKGTSDNNLLKLFLVMTFAMAMLFFSIIFSLHFMIEKKGGSDCVEMMGTKAIYDYGKAINSKSMAEKLAEMYVKNNKNEYNLRFLKGGLESCGPVFTFIDRMDNAKYAVCETGKIYDYVMKCKD
ncbi:MAG: hypothetical protein ABIG84_04815 [archaeon]